MSKRALVESVLTGSEESGRIIIHDSTECNGRPLLKFAVCELSKRYEEIQVFLYEGDCVQWVKGLPPSIAGRLTLHNCSHALCDGADSAMQPLLAFSPTVGKPCAVVIDSLSSLLLRCSISSLARWLATQSHDCLLALLHSDLHTAGVLAQLDYVTTAKLTVSGSRSRDEAVGYKGTVSTMLRKSSGKILTQNKGYLVSLDCTAVETKEVDPIQATPTSRPPPVDPAANLTFDLHLSAQEKEARSHVVLPYTSAQQEGSMHSSTGGEIFYEADEMDFEDSDPDDDLDF